MVPLALLIRILWRNYSREKHGHRMSRKLQCFKIVWQGKVDGPPEWMMMKLFGWTVRDTWKWSTMLQMSPRTMAGLPSAISAGFMFTNLTCNGRKKRRTNESGSAWPQLSWKHKIRENKRFQHVICKSDTQLFIQQSRGRRMGWDSLFIQSIQSSMRCFDLP